MLSAAQEYSCPKSATEHFIPGKDASLEASIATLQSKLEAIGFHIEERSWLNPVEGVWSVRIRDRACPLLFNSGNTERGICAIPYQRLSDGKTVYIPVNLIGNLYVSNGMSAGNTLMEARTQALSEIFERHIKFRIIEEGLCLPDVPEDVIARYPHIAAGIRGLREAGFGILVKDASLGGRYPVMNVTLLHPHDQGCFASFGAHPRFEVALERALTELLQGRALDSLEGFPAPGFDQTEIADPQNLEIHFVDSSGVISWQFLRDTPDFDFGDWNFGTTTEEDYAWSVGALHAEGREIYVADFEHLGVYACRILVPGVSEIYPVEELEFENNSVGNLLRPALARLPELVEAECAALFDLMIELELADDRLVSVLIGLAPDADSPWTDLRIGELKLLLALAIGDDDAILEGCTWIAQYGQRSDARLKVYRCIADLVRLADRGPFEPALAVMYGRETLEQAFALFNQDERFFGLTTLGDNFEGSTIHQRLLEAYRKVRG